MVSVQDGFYFLFVSSEPEHLVCSWECLCFFFGFFFFKFFNFFWFNDWNVFLHKRLLWSNFLLVLAHHSFLNDWRRWYLFLFNFFHFFSFISFFMFIFFLFFFFCVISLSFFFWWNKKEVIFVGLAFLLFFGDDFLT